MAAFKLPEIMPQDLLLIHDLVEGSDVPARPKNYSRPLTKPDDECIDSSDSDDASQVEVEADLLIKGDEGAPDALEA